MAPKATKKAAAPSKTIMKVTKKSAALTKTVMKAKAPKATKKSAAPGKTVMKAKATNATRKSAAPTKTVLKAKGVSTILIPTPLAAAAAMDIVGNKNVGPEHCGLSPPPKQGMIGIAGTVKVERRGDVNAPEALERRLPETKSNGGTDVRQFKVKTVGGSEREIVVPGDANITYLEAQVAQAMGLGLCFSLATMGEEKPSTPLPLAGQRLARKPRRKATPADEKFAQAPAALPIADDITCIIENPSSLCVAAQEVLKRVRPKVLNSKDFKELAETGLGRCRTLGSLKTAQFKEDPYMPEWMAYHLEDDMDIGKYDVVELELIDGAKKCHKLVGVINDGDADCNSGLWGPIYLRPSFKMVGGITSSGDTESEWKISDSSWYVEDAMATYPCGHHLCGGPQAFAPVAFSPSPWCPFGPFQSRADGEGHVDESPSSLKQHLAHALSVAKFPRHKFKFGF